MALACRLYPQDTEQQAVLKLCKRAQASYQRTVDFYEADEETSLDEGTRLKTDKESLELLQRILVN